MEFRKGQAAMEFLMTYGWAILAAIIAIGVLAYFGVFSPGKLISSSGVMSPPFSVSDFNIVNDGINENDGLNFILVQNSGKSIFLQTTGLAVKLGDADATECALTTDAGEIDVLTDGDADGYADTQWPSGVSVKFEAGCGDGNKFTEGEAVRGDLTVKYRTSSGGLGQQSTGSVRGTAQ